MLQRVCSMHQVRKVNKPLLQSKTPNEPANRYVHGLPVSSNEGTGLKKTCPLCSGIGNCCCGNYFEGNCEAISEVPRGDTLLLYILKNWDNIEQKNREASGVKSPEFKE